VDSCLEWRVTAHNIRANTIAQGVVGAAPLFRTPAGAYISGTTLMIDGGRHVI
jgi:hypothetical protein